MKKTFLKKFILGFVFSGLIFLSVYFVFLQPKATNIIQAQTGPQINSAPSSIQHKQPVTISGSGFGTKSSAAPLKWDDFEGGAVGNDIGGGWYLENRGGPNPKYVNDRLRGASTKSCYQDYTEQYGCVLALTDLNSYKYYITFWRYMTTSGAPSRNFKPLGLRGDIDWNPPTGRHDMYFDSDSGHIYTNQDETNSISIGSWDCGADWPMGSWNRIEYYYDRGTPNTTTGYISYVRDGVTKAEASGLVATSNWVWPVIFLNSYFAIDTGSPQPQARIWSDDIYIDTTQARIELGDKSTWNTCTHREIQIPTAWSSNSITFTANKGSFNDGPAYLYVVDSEGNVNSQGYPVTIGSGAPDTTPPSVPSGVNVE